MKKNVKVPMEFNSGTMSYQPDLEELPNEKIVETVKGFRDFSGEDSEKRALIKKMLINEFESYGFESAETPVVEYEEFVRGDNKEDEAVSDIFSLKDKGDRELALRYEFTFQLKRLAQNKKLPYRRYQIGEVFRDEPVSANRFRQFTQCDVDIVGSSVKEEAEVLSIVKNVLDKLNIKFVVYINNRKLLNQILDQEEIKEKDREDVIREIDKLDKLSEKEVKENLKKYKAEKVLEVLKSRESIFKSFSAYKEIEELKKYCEYYGLEIKFLPSLARGLSYYNGSVYEIKALEKGIKESICAGGSYIVNGVQSTGISFGLERLSTLAKVENKKEKILIISIDKDKEAIKLAEKLRKNEGVVVNLWTAKGISKALDYANSKKINKVIFVGEEEVKKKKFKVKDMKSGKESWMKI